MKTFWCSLGVFLLLIGAIVFNFIYVNRTADELIRLTENVPEDPTGADEALEALAGYWKSNRDFLGMSVSYTELNRVDDLIVAMQSHGKQAETADYLCDRALLLPAICEIRRLEQFHVWNIF